MTYSPHQLANFAHQLTRRAASSSMDCMAGALLDAQVDLNPHQIDAALFATSNPLSKGVILTDEVGLGKPIEAGLLIAQKWAERKRRILVITPANLRKLLASSTFAIAGALETLIKRLGQTLDEKAATTDLADEPDQDYETLDELADESMQMRDAVADGSTKANDANPTAAEITAIRAEVCELESFRNLTISIAENAKGTALLQALKVAFKKLDELGAAKKAVVFTESRRTQEYLLKLRRIRSTAPACCSSTAATAIPVPRRSTPSGSPGMPAPTGYPSHAPPIPVPHWSTIFATMLAKAAAS